MGTEFEVGTRPLDGVCPDCGRVIRDGVWFRHRQVAHGATLTLAPTTGSAASEGPDAPVVALRPTDGVCPDCGRRIAPELWDNHRQHVHGSRRVTDARPTSVAGGPQPPSVGSARGSTPARRRETPPTNPARARFATTVGAGVTALVCLVIFLGDIADWAERSESCRVLGRAHKATTPTTPPTCGFYAVVAPLQNIALILGLAALVLALVAPLIPDGWFGPGDD